MTSQYQRPSSPLGIMRNSTFAMPRCLRPEMSIRMNQDTIHCAALRAQKSTQAQLSAPRRNIGHLIHRGAAFLAVSWSHHNSQRLDRPSGFLAGSRGVGDVASARSRGLRAGGRELETNFDEFSTCSDAEPVIGGIVRVPVIVTPRGILLVVHMPNDRHRNQNDGCAED